MESSSKSLCTKIAHAAPSLRTTSESLRSTRPLRDTINGSLRLSTRPNAAQDPPCCDHALSRQVVPYALRGPDSSFRPFLRCQSTTRFARGEYSRQSVHVRSHLDQPPPGSPSVPARARQLGQNEPRRGQVPTYQWYVPEPWTRSQVESSPHRTTDDLAGFRRISIN